MKLKYQYGYVVVLYEVNINYKASRVAPNPYTKPLVMLMGVFCKTEGWYMPPNILS